MDAQPQTTTRLSPWWRQSCVLVMVLGFSVLIWLAVRTYQDAPPIPERVTGPSSATLFTRADIEDGQQVFLKYGLMENGTVWGHGAYLGPDFSAEYLHALTSDAAAFVAQQRFGSPVDALPPRQADAVRSEARSLLKENRFDSASRTLRFSEAEEASYRKQVDRWARYFSEPARNGGLPPEYIRNAEEIRHLTAFFAWTAWASVVNRPGRAYSYTNNFPFDPDAGNTPSVESILWSALSLIFLLGGIGLALLAFGKFDFLGWKGSRYHVHPRMLPGTTTESQRATIKYFVVVALLFLAQTLVGGGTAHYRADPAGFYGFDLLRLFPSSILRTWHLQLAIFWVATAYVAGGLFLAPAVGGADPPGQVKGINLLFAGLVVVVGGSLLGEMLGINQALGRFWFWFGHQGWEYLDLGRAWQILLAGALVLWVVLLFRSVRPARGLPERAQISSLFLYAAVAIPVFYLPAMFFDSTTHFSVVDTWRFWIVHLWVEGFFEVFATAMVALIFFELGMISQVTATRVVYLDAILYLGSGIIGTGHHWYWTGQSHVTMALAATFSAMEVVPLTLLTLDAWDFFSLTRATCDVCHQKVAVPHKWTFYFLIAVGVWNFVGAGVFGFLINLPIVSYFEVGTILTPNHGHAAMMGVFGMLGVALMVFAFRQVLADREWKVVEPYIRVSFWGLNVGLALMIVTNLFPGGIAQLVDVLTNGYWHARSPQFLASRLMRTIEWLRMPGDLVFIVAGAAPLAIAGLRAFLLVSGNGRKSHPVAS